MLRFTTRRLCAAAAQKCNIAYVGVPLSSSAAVPRFSFSAAKMWPLPPQNTSAFVAPMEGRAMGVARGPMSEDVLRAFEASTVFPSELSITTSEPTSYALCTLVSSTEGLCLSTCVFGHCCVAVVGGRGTAKFYCGSTTTPQIHYLTVAEGDAVVLMSNDEGCEPLTKVIRRIGCPSPLEVECAAEEILESHGGDNQAVVCAKISPMDVRTALRQAPLSSF